MRERIAKTVAALKVAKAEVAASKKRQALILKMSKKKEADFAAFLGGLTK